MICDYIPFLDLVKIVTPQGKVKNTRRQVSELIFDFKIESIGELFWSCKTRKAKYRITFSFTYWQISLHGPFFSYEERSECPCSLFCKFTLSFSSYTSVLEVLIEKNLFLMFLFSNWSSGIARRAYWRIYAL